MDGWTVSQIRLLLGVEEFLTDLGGRLRARTFDPSPTRRVEIPKANGKVRQDGDLAQMIWNVPEVIVSNLLRSMVKDGRKFADLPG